MALTNAWRRRRNRPAGQSLVELALLLPVLLLVVLVTLDFGRALYGWVILQNSARIAANFAGANPDGWSGSGDTDIQDDYEAQIERDLNTANCVAPTTPPTPVFNDGPDSPVAGGYPDTAYDVGDTVVVSLSCEFSPVTPIIGDIVGSTLELSASSEFRIRSGELVGLANPTQIPAPGATPTPIPSGPPGPTPTPAPTPCPAPVANFSGAPLTGNGSVTVNLTDLSTTSPGCPITSWQWTFEGATPATATGQGPHSVTFTKPPTQHDVTLTVTNAGGSNTKFVNNYVRTN